MPFSVDSTESFVAGTYYPPVAAQANPAMQWNLDGSQRNCGCYATGSF